MRRLGYGRAAPFRVFSASNVRLSGFACVLVGSQSRWQRLLDVCGGDLRQPGQQVDLQLAARAVR